MKHFTQYASLLQNEASTTYLIFNMKYIQGGADYFIRLNAIWDNYSARYVSSLHYNCVIQGNSIDWIQYMTYFVSCDVKLHFEIRTSLGPHFVGVSSR